MVLDLKVLVKSFNCEDRSCCAGNPRESFCDSRKKMFDSRKCRESWILWIITATSCRTFTFPFIGSSQASAGEASTAKYHGFEAHPSTCRWYCPTLLSEVYKLQMQQPKLPNVRLCKAKHQGSCWRKSMCILTRVAYKAMKNLSVIIWCDLAGDWMNLHKRSCCSTWVRSSRKFRERFFFAKNGSSRIKELWSTGRLHL